jgi:hypothetical protein
MKRLRDVWAIAAVVALMAANAQAQSECAELSIRLEGIPEALGARCGGTPNGSLETIDAGGPEARLHIRHQQAGARSYFWRLTPTDILRKLPETEREGEPFEVGNFDVMRYRTRMDGQAAACFVFVGYAGHVEHSTGYRHSVIGFYCSLAGEETSDARVSELLGGVVADFWRGCGGDGAKYLGSNSHRMEHRPS